MRSSNSSTIHVPFKCNEKSDAGANVVGKVVNRENKFKAVSNPVWVCLKAMI